MCKNKIALTATTAAIFTVIDTTLKIALKRKLTPLSIIGTYVGCIVGDIIMDYLIEESQ